MTNKRHYAAITEIRNNYCGEMRLEGDGRRSFALGKK